MKSWKVHSRQSSKPGEAQRPARRKGMGLSWIFIILSVTVGLVAFTPLPGMVGALLLSVPAVRQMYNHKHMLAVRKCASALCAQVRMACRTVTRQLARIELPFVEALKKRMQACKWCQCCASLRKDVARGMARVCATVRKALGLRAR